MDGGMDLLQGVQDAEDQAGQGPLGGNFEMPSMEKMLEIVKQLDMPEEDKKQLIESIQSKGDFLGKMAEMGSNMGPKMQAPAPIGGSFDPTVQFLLFFLAIAIVVVIFVFFASKLYKTLMGRELKKVQKKQQKKKK